jgi:hypothetical protein
MTEHARVKINLKLGEIEIEGSESFVSKQLEEIPGLIESLNISDSFEPEPSASNLIDPIAKDETQEANANGQQGSENSSDELSVPDSFGELLST